MRSPAPGRLPSNSAQKRRRGRWLQSAAHGSEAVAPFAGTPGRPGVALARSARAAARALHDDQAHEDAASAQRERCHGEEDEKAERVHRTGLAIAVTATRWDRAGGLGSPERVRSIQPSPRGPPRRRRQSPAAPLNASLARAAEQEKPANAGNPKSQAVGSAAVAPAGGMPPQSRGFGSPRASPFRSWARKAWLASRILAASSS